MQGIDKLQDATRYSFIHISMSGVVVVFTIYLVLSGLIDVLYRDEIHS